MIAFLAISNSGIPISSPLSYYDDVWSEFLYNTAFVVIRIIWIWKVGLLKLDRHNLVTYLDEVGAICTFKYSYAVALIQILKQYVFFLPQNSSLYIYPQFLVLIFSTFILQTEVAKHSREFWCESTGDTPTFSLEVACGYV